MSGNSKEFKKGYEDGDQPVFDRTDFGRVKQLEGTRGKKIPPELTADVRRMIEENDKLLEKVRDE